MFHTQNKTKKKELCSRNILWTNGLFSKYTNIWIILLYLIGYCAPLVCVIFKSLQRRKLLYPAKICSLLCNKAPTLALASRTIHLRSHDNIRMTVGTLIITVMKPSHAVLLYINYTFIRVLEWSSTIRTRPCRRLWNKSLSLFKLGNCQSVRNQTNYKTLTVKPISRRITKVRPSESSAVLPATTANVVRGDDWVATILTEGQVQQ